VKLKAKRSRPISRFYRSNRAALARRRVTPKIAPSKYYFVQLLPSFRELCFVIFIKQKCIAQNVSRATLIARERSGRVKTFTDSLSLSLSLSRARARAHNRFFLCLLLLLRCISTQKRRAGSNNKRIKLRAVAFSGRILAEDLRLALNGVTKESERREWGEGREWDAKATALHQSQKPDIFYVQRRMIAALARAHSIFGMVLRYVNYFLCH